MAKWAPGQSGNPVGNNVAHPLIQRIKARARLDAAEAYEKILEILRSSGKDETILAAAREILRLAGANLPDVPQPQPMITASPSMSAEELEKGLGPPPVN